MDVGKALGLHALAGIHDEKRSFAGRERAGDFVSKVDVAWGVDEVDLVDVAIFGLVVHGDGMGLDRDAAFALQVHGVEHLLLHFALSNRASHLQEAVGNGRLAMVDMGDDGKIANKFSVVCKHAVIFFQGIKVTAKYTGLKRKLPWQVCSLLLPSEIHPL